VEKKSKSKKTGKNAQTKKTWETFNVASLAWRNHIGSSVTTHDHEDEYYKAVFNKSTGSK